MNIVEKKRTSKLAEYCLQCFFPMVTVKNKTDSDKHSQKRRAVTRRRKKNRHTCLNTSCLEHFWICLKHTDQKRTLIEAHYKEFSIWDQQIPAQTFENQRDSKLDRGKPSHPNNQAQRRRKKAMAISTPQDGHPETNLGAVKPASDTNT